MCVYFQVVGLPDHGGRLPVIGLSSEVQPFPPERVGPELQPSWGVWNEASVSGKGQSWLETRCPQVGSCFFVCVVFCQYLKVNWLVEAQDGAGVRSPEDFSGNHVFTGELLQQSLFVFCLFFFLGKL